MKQLSKPWSAFMLEGQKFTPDDCLLSEVSNHEIETGLNGVEYSELMNIHYSGHESKKLILHPYPKDRSAENPNRVEFPKRPKAKEIEKETGNEAGVKILKLMNATLARVQEFEDALDTPEKLWSTLNKAWKKAESEEDPRMAEIVRQAKEMRPKLNELINQRLRKVLRRSEELIAISRVQEMNRASMRWLSRQPGSTIAQRAGSSQQILAIARHENFDTHENRVLLAYVILANQVARQWMNEHEHHSTRSGDKYPMISEFGRHCRLYEKSLRELGIKEAQVGIVPNFVLSDDKLYNTVYKSWIRLLKREEALDNLWIWQSEIWTDFAILAIVLAIDELEESELIAQSPILWNDEAKNGRLFNQESPLAVFWLKNTNCTVDILTRPKNAGAPQSATRAYVALKITEIGGRDGNINSMPPKRVVVWTPHTMNRIDLQKSVNEGKERLSQLKRAGLLREEILRNGLIIAPGYGKYEITNSEPDEEKNSVSVQGIAFDPHGEPLASGMEAIRKFIKDKLTGGE